MYSSRAEQADAASIDADSTGRGGNTDAGCYRNFEHQLPGGVNNQNVAAAERKPDPSTATQKAGRVAVGKSILGRWTLKSC